MQRCTVYIVHSTMYTVHCTGRRNYHYSIHYIGYTLLLFRVIGIIDITLYSYIGLYRYYLYYYHSHLVVTLILSILSIVKLNK